MASSPPAWERPGRPPPYSRPQIRGPPLTPGCRRPRRSLQVCLLLTFDHATPQSLSSCLGPNGFMIPEIEWMNQVLLTVETVSSGSLIEITVFGQPRVQNRVKSVLLSLAARYRENRARGEALRPACGGSPGEPPGRTWLPSRLSYLPNSSRLQAAPGIPLCGVPGGPWGSKLRSDTFRPITAHVGLSLIIQVLPDPGSEPPPREMVLPAPLPLLPFPLPAMTGAFLFIQMRR